MICWRSPSRPRSASSSRCRRICSLLSLLADPPDDSFCEESACSFEPSEQPEVLLYPLGCLAPPKVAFTIPSTSRQSYMSQLQPPAQQSWRNCPLIAAGCGSRDTTSVSAAHLAHLLWTSRRSGMYTLVLSARRAGSAHEDSYHVSTGLARSKQPKPRK